VKSAPEDSILFQNIYYRCLRDMTTEQKADIRKTVNPKFLYNAVKNRGIPKGDWESFIKDEFGWALRSDLPISMSPLKMLDALDLHPVNNEKRVRASAQKFINMHSLPTQFNMDDFQNCLDTMNILISAELLEEVFDCVIEDGDYARMEDLAVFFGYVWGPRIDRVKADILSWLEHQIDLDLETKMRSALKQGKRYSALDLQLAFGEDKDLSYMKQLYSNLLQEEENIEVESKREPGTTSDLTQSEPEQETKKSPQMASSMVDNRSVPNRISNIEALPRSQAGTVVESIGDLTSTETTITTDQKLDQSPNARKSYTAPLKEFTESDSKSTTDSVGQKRDPSSANQESTQPDSLQHSVDSAMFESMMHRKVITQRRKAEESDGEEDSIEQVHRSPSVMHAVRAVSKSVEPSRRLPTSERPESKQPEDTGTIHNRSMASQGGGEMPTDTYPTPTPTSATFTREGGFLFPGVDNRDFHRRITEGAGVAGMQSSYSRRISEGGLVSSLQEPSKLAAAQSSFPKVSVGLFDILDAQQSHSRTSTAQTFSRAGQMLPRVPEAPDVKPSNSATPKNNVRYCKLEQPSSTAITMPNISEKADWKIPRELWICFSVLSFLDTCSDLYMAFSIISKPFGWLSLVVLLIGFRAVLISWVLPNYTPFYDHPINFWTMLSTWCPFSAVWHSAVPFPPKTQEELVQGLLHQFGVEFVLIPLFTILYIPFTLYVVCDSVQWTLTIFEQRFIFWNIVQLFESIPMFLTSLVLFICGFRSHSVVLSIILSGLSTAKSTYVYHNFRQAVNPGKRLETLE